MNIHEAATLIIEFLEMSPEERRIELDREQLTRMLFGCTQVMYGIQRELYEPERREPLGDYRSHEDHAHRGHQLLVAETNQSYSIVHLAESGRQRRSDRDVAFTANELDPSCLKQACHDKVRLVRDTLLEWPFASKIAIIEKTIGVHRANGTYDPPWAYRRLNALLNHKCHLPERDAAGRVLPKYSSA